jgi:DNA-directed RNA polymerase subunit RPC12/RpoP
MDNLYLCTLCRGKFPFEKITYSHNGKRIVCKGCYEKIDIPKDVEHRVEVYEPKKTDKIKVICLKCRYKFTVQLNQRSNIMCPYCGGNRLMRDEATAEKILSEVSHRPDRYS